MPPKSAALLAHPVCRDGRLRVEVIPSVVLFLERTLEGSTLLEEESSPITLHHYQAGPGGCDLLSKTLECALEHFVIVKNKLAKAVSNTADD